MEGSASSASGAAVSLETFAARFDRYPGAAAPLFHLVRDLLVKGLVEELRVVDGASIGRDGYLVRAKRIPAAITDNGTNSGSGSGDGTGSALYVPVDVVKPIDLTWFHDLTAVSAEPVFLCIHSPDGIIYERISHGIQSA